MKGSLHIRPPEFRIRRYLPLFDRILPTQDIPRYRGRFPPGCRPVSAGRVPLRESPVPDEYLQLLRFSNGLRGNGSLLAGIYPENPELPDLLRLNLRVRHPLCRDLIILGVNEMDYLGYNHKWQVYQIIDKDDFEVLEEYHELTAALNDILKI